MTFDKINRRTHLYAGILLTPWFLLYAGSSVILNHGEWFESVRKHDPPWTKVSERPYRLPPITDDSDPWELSEKLLKDFGMLGRYRALFDDSGKLVTIRHRFLSMVRLTYDADRGLVVVEQKPRRFDEFLTAAHFRAGFAYPYLLEVLWGGFVDAIALGTLIWIVSGLYIWVKLKRLRFWGWVALGSGFASFALLLAGL